jgi:hypothetical protein
MSFTTTKDSRDWLEEGSVFGVPLQNGKVALGVLGRVDDNIGFGYFFRPFYDALPTQTNLPELRASDAFFSALFSVASLRAREWPVVARLEPWTRNDWRVPPLARYDVLREEYVAVMYADSLAAPEAENALPPGTSADWMPSDDLFSPSALSARLSRLETDLE